MKELLRYFLLLLLLLLLPRMARAQEVYRLVMESAERTLRDPGSGFAMTRVAQFKKAALVYMKDRVVRREDKPDGDEPLLDTQAYYLSEFTTLYVKEILKSKRAGSEKLREKTQLFMNASRSNPLFHDTDRSAADTYVQAGNEITPFSLDTDWEKAYLEVKRKL